MKKILLFLSACSLHCVFAESNLNITFIEGSVLLRESDEGKEIERTLTRLKESLENEIKSLEQKIQSSITNLSNKAKLLDAEMLESEQNKVMQLRKEHELKANQAQEEFQRKVNIELGKFQKKVQEAIKDFAIKNGLDAVIMKESGEVVYCSKKADSTSDLLEVLNKKYNENKTQKKNITPSKN